MKEFDTITFDPTKVREELADLENLVKSNVDLAERKDLQPFFEQRRQLSAFMGTY